MHDVHPPVPAVQDAARRALAEDLAPLGDLTSALLPPDLRATVTVVPRQDGVLAGRLCADETLRLVDPDLEVAWRADDGDPVDAGRAICRIEGLLSSILTAERTALNFLGHLSGVATATAGLVAEIARAGGHARLWDTRKTTPGLRSLEKAAVRAGGGANHRGNLSEWVLLKDNHLAHLPVAVAVDAARRRWPGRTVEVECDEAAAVAVAADAGADVILLDNMSPDEVRAVVADVRAARPERPLLEVSGGVDQATVAAYAASGVDMISVGALTHSAPVLDIGLDVTCA